VGLVAHGATAGAKVAEVLELVPAGQGAVVGLVGAVVVIESLIVEEFFEKGGGHANSQEAIPAKDALGNSCRVTHAIVST